MRHADTDSGPKNIDHEIAKPRMPSGHKQLGSLDGRRKQRQRANLCLPAPAKTERCRHARESEDQQMLGLMRNGGGRAKRRGHERQQCDRKRQNNERCSPNQCCHGERAASAIPAPSIAVQS